MYDCSRVRGNFSPLLTIVPEHRDLFIRERREKSYGALTFVISYLLHCIPPAVVSVSCTSFILYFQLEMMPGFNNFLIFGTTFFVLQMFGELVGVTLVRDGMLGDGSSDD